MKDRDIYYSAKKRDWFFALQYVGGVVILMVMGGVSLGILALTFVILGPIGLLLGVPAMLFGFVSTFYLISRFGNWCDCQGGYYQCDRG